MTTLLHACQPAAQSGGAAHHSEPLGRGVCSFHLSVPPSGASLRLMRALMHQLAARLRLEAAEGAAAATAATPACRVSASAEAPGAAQPLHVCSYSPPRAALTAPPGAHLARRASPARPRHSLAASRRRRPPPAVQPPMARGAAAAPRPAYAAPAPSGALGHSMPADCFWMSM